MWIDDQVLENCEQDLVIRTWIPERPMVVLGRGNRASVELDREACAQDAVPIFKRFGGGGTVLLHSGCLVVSLGAWVRDYYQNDKYFRALNNAIIDTILLGAPSLSLGQRGHSDIVCGQLKCAGTSLFRSRNYLLFQASILYDVNIDMIERYLKHPSAEPDYRRGRSHRDFLIGLSELGLSSLDACLLLFEQHLRPNIYKHLANDLCSSQVEQCGHLLKRVGETLEIDS